MHLRILIPTIQFAEIHEESLKDAVHPEFILREIQKLQSAILILAGKGRVPNQPADIKNQLINPAKPMLKKPPQQTFSNPNLLNMRKFCQSLSQPGSDILINSLYPHQSPRHPPLPCQAGRLRPRHNRADNTDFQLEFSVASQNFSLLQINSYLSSSSKQIKPLMILSARQSWFYLRIMPQS